MNRPRRSCSTSPEKGKSGAIGARPERGAHLWVSGGLSCGPTAHKDGIRVWLHKPGNRQMHGTISHCCVLMQLRIPSNSQLVPWDWYWETSTRMEKPGKGWLIGTGCLFRTRVVFFYWTSLPATTGSEPWPCLNIKSFRSVLSFVVESSDFQFSDPQRRRNSSSR